jgi:hypothetical protein
MNVSNKFKTIPVTARDRINEYNDNLHIIDAFSFFISENQLICVKFPVPKKKYEVKNIYNLSNATKNRIVIHITDNTNDSVKGKPKDFMVSGIFDVSDIINTGSFNLSLNDTTSLTVMVFNDNSQITNTTILDLNIEDYFSKLENNPTKKFDALPNEAGGGVIVKGP